jgi:alanine-glyoxylate transaminase/serine-glyoxylate transaminase/serine-pyruvate transaminase
MRSVRVIVVGGGIGGLSAAGRPPCGGDLRQRRQRRGRCAPQVFARHARHASATRAAVRAWGLDVVCLDEGAHSMSVTAVMLSDGYNADKLRDIILDRFDMSLGGGLGKLAGSTFRIGHLGHFNDLTLAGTLAGVQMGLQLAEIPIDPSGVNVALEMLRA